MSAGSIGTPQILMNSGIGDPQELASLNITPRVDLPSVGKNLSVHIATSVVHFVNSTNTFDDVIRNEPLRTELLAQWNRTHDGVLGESFSSFGGFARMAANASIFETHPDPAAGPNTFQNGVSVRERRDSVASMLTGLCRTVISRYRRLDISSA